MDLRSRPVRCVLVHGRLLHKGGVVLSAEIIPFPNAVAETFESFARLARAGEVTGVVLAALGPGRLAEDTYSAVSGVNYTERRALISTLEDAATMALLYAQDDY